MTSTNRGANRLLILACGMLLLCVGCAAAAGVLVPTIRDAWKDVAGQASLQVSTWLGQTPLGATGASWIPAATLALLVIVVIALIVFVARQGRGRTRVAVTEASDHGTTILDAAVAEQAVHDALVDQPGLVGSQVSTYAVRRVPVLKVSVTCRRGVSPKDIATIVEDRLRALDELLGRELPALIQISGGFRSRTTRSTRLQ